MKKIKWFTINGIIIYMMYVGLYENVEWAQNIVKFIIWLNLIVTTIMFFALLNDDIEKEHRGKIMTMPPNFNLYYGLITAVIFASFGWFGYATMDIITTLMQSAFYNKENENNS